MALAGALGRATDMASTRRAANKLREFTAFSQYHSAGGPRGRITTTTKTNGSISSKAGIVFYGNWTDMLPGDCVYAPWLGPAFKNNTDQPVRVFINFAPSGFELLAEAAEAWAQPEPDDPHSGHCGENGL